MVLAPLTVPALIVLRFLYAGSGFESPFFAYLAAVAALSYLGFMVFGLIARAGTARG